MSCSNRAVWSHAKNRQSWISPRLCRLHTRPDQLLTRLGPCWFSSRSADIVLIDRLELQFDGGLSVLTGETGRRQVDSVGPHFLSLWVGGETVRSCAMANPQGQITAIFRPCRRSSPARVIAKAAEIDTEGDLISPPRPDGRRAHTAPSSMISRSACRCCGRWASRLVEIHGQHDDRAMIDPWHPPHHSRRLWRAWRPGRTGPQRGRHCRRGTQGARQPSYPHREGAPRRGGPIICAMPWKSSKPSPRNRVRRPNWPNARQSMMQAEKVAGELSQAHDVLRRTGLPGPVVLGCLAPAGAAGGTGSAIAGAGGARP